MEHINKLSDRIVTMSPESPDKETAINAVSLNINYFISDIAKAIHNINETSLNSTDMSRRVSKLSEQTGISVETINLLTT